MNTIVISIETVFATLLFLHVLVNTISRVCQRKFGNSDPLFDTEQRPCLPNFRNRSVIQGVGILFHLLLVAIGLAVCCYFWPSEASGAYLGLLFGGAALLLWIYQGLKNDTKHRTDASKQNRQTWIGFYTLMFAGCVAFSHLGKWSPHLIAIDALSFILFVANQFFCKHKKDAAGPQASPA